MPGYSGPGITFLVDAAKYVFDRKLLRGKMPFCQIGPVERHSHRCARLGAQSVRSDACLSISVTQRIKKQPPSALIEALLRRQLGGITPRQQISGAPREGPDTVKIASPVQWHVNVQPSGPRCHNECPQTEIFQ